MKLTHCELVKKVAQNTRMTEKDVDTFMKALQFAIVDAVEEEGDSAYIKNIGKFEMKKRRGKVDALSGKRIKRDDKLYISFTPSRGLTSWKV
jgi:nucleoid DNA-binding protein